MKETTVVVIVSVILAVVALVLAGSYMSFRHDERMAELGYEEVCYPGSGWTRWSKVSPGCEKEGK
jgi:hypothetical protein